MIYTVTLNPALDYVVDVERFTSGRVNRSQKEKLLPGGKGLNVSWVLKNLGMESVALGFCAGFTGEQLKEELARKGIVEELIPVKNGFTRINIKVCSDEETEINGQGPDIDETAIAALCEKLRRLETEDVLVLAGSVPKMLPQTIYMDFMEMLEEKELKIVVDAGGDLLMNTLKYRPFLIKPNKQELEDLFKIPMEDRDTIKHYAKELQKQGARNVLVSLAGEGAILLGENGSFYEACAPKGKVKNSVGAGDSMIAGFLSGYLKKKDLKEAFYKGICCGSASAFSEELATKEEVEMLLKQYEIAE